MTAAIIFFIGAGVMTLLSQIVTRLEWISTSVSVSRAIEKELREKLAFTEKELLERCERAERLLRDTLDRHPGIAAETSALAEWWARDREKRG